jgi:MerR family transcriptional regulator, mercuric resistance operon regulatory protein
LRTVDAHFTIGQLARETGVPVSTIRYYERSKLLRPEARSAGNYRLYGPTALERLRFIRAAQANGFSLEEVATLLAFRDGRTAPCREVQELIEHRLAALEERVEQLRQLQSALRSSLETCRTSEQVDDCGVLKDLGKTATTPEGQRRKP